MSITFPLYDNLVKDLDNQEFAQKDQDKFMKLIKTFDLSGYEIIYILIICYQMEHNEYTTTSVLPYSGKYVNNDITFDFNEFPNDLKKILFKFAKVHTKKMSEENLLKENRTELTNNVSVKI